MNKLSAIGTAAVSLVLLSGCAAGPGSSPDNLIATEWKYTEVGDVLCLDYLIPDIGRATDCDWNTLTSAHERTSEDTDMVNGGWYLIDGYDGRVFCLTTVVSKDCNFPND